MDTTFYVAAVIAILATVMVVTRLNAVHALLYLIVSLLSVAIVFYTLGAPFIAALEVVVYAGAIMILFVFVVMMLNLGPQTTKLQRIWLKPRMFVGPCILSAMLIAEVAYLLSQAGNARQGAVVVGPKEVGLALFGPYLIGVELASMLLLGALVGAYHLGKRKRERMETRYVGDSNAARDSTGGNIIRSGTDLPSRAA